MKSGKQGGKGSAVALSAAMAVTCLAGVAQADDYDTFYGTGDYTYCDARLLAAYWGQSEFDSKLRAGGKIARGEDYVVKDYLARARDYAIEHSIRCTLEDADNPVYSYQDAMRLARYWGVNTPEEAKLKIVEGLERGENRAIRNELAAAIQRGY